MIIWSHDHIIIWSYDHMIILSYDHLIMWSTFVNFCQLLVGKSWQKCTFKVDKSAQKCTFKVDKSAQKCTFKVNKSAQKLTKVQSAGLVKAPMIGHLRISKFNLYWILCCSEVWEIIKNFRKIFEILKNGPLNKGVFKEFIFSKIAWSPKSSTWEAVMAAKRPWKLPKWRILGFRQFWKRWTP